MHTIGAPIMRAAGLLTARASGNHEAAFIAFYDEAETHFPGLTLCVPNVQYARELAGAINAIRDLHATPSEKRAA